MYVRELNNIIGKVIDLIFGVFSVGPFKRKFQLNLNV